MRNRENQERRGSGKYQRYNKEDQKSNYKGKRVSGFKKSFSSEEREKEELPNSCHESLFLAYSKEQIQKFAVATLGDLKKMLFPEAPSHLRGYALALWYKEGVTQEQKKKEVRTLDPWQEEALQALKDGFHVIVDAPTSAGKTRVIEALLDDGIEQGLRLIYTSPVKSLSNDKYREFSERYGSKNVGINTGDFKENLQAPIVLATLETYRNGLLGIEPKIHRGVIVYDEYHYLQDEGRGSAWEESIVLTPKETQMILLSASIPNTDEFATWIESLTERKVKIIRVQKRPVPLVDLVYTPEGFVLPQYIINEENTLETFKENSIKVPSYLRGEFEKMILQDLPLLVYTALQEKLGPMIVYAGRRASVEALALLVSKYLRGKKFKANPALKERISSIKGWEYVPEILQKSILETGVAYHHSGLIPAARVSIETLLKEGLLHVCTGTMGISLGVNFAVRSALIFDHSRPGDSGETPYDATERMQMLGRAGRRGIDKQGFSLWLNVERYAKSFPRDRSPCESSLKFDPCTILGLLGQYQSYVLLSHFYKKSFFMRNQSQDDILIPHDDIIRGFLYEKYKVEKTPCDDVYKTIFDFMQKPKSKRKGELCFKCPTHRFCAEMMKSIHSSRLSESILHLENIGALEKEMPTYYGELARHFPQAGGLIVAKMLVEFDIDGRSFDDYVPLFACFCGSSHKIIHHEKRRASILKTIDFYTTLLKYYPYEIFPEYYDQRSWGRNNNPMTSFRDFNLDASVVVTSWLDTSTTWEQMEEWFVSEKVSSGDIMMILFRFATFMQSFTRLKLFPTIAARAEQLRKMVLRDPLTTHSQLKPIEEEEINEK